MPPTVKKIVSVMDGVVLSIASIGILLPVICKVKDLSHRIDLEKAAEKFKVEIALKIQNGVVKPPSNDPLEMKSNDRTFNHFADYAINDSVIWYRSRTGNDEERRWKPMFFDGDLTGTKPDVYQLMGPI